MNGPTKKPKIGLGLEPLESAIVFAGLVVVFGLYLESGPDWAQAAKNHAWPARPITGTALVALGVFAEVAIGLFIARSAKRAQLQAEELISLAEKATAEANERTANLQMAVADARERQARAEQVIADLRRAQAPRVMTFDFQGFAGYLINRPRGKAKIFFLEGDAEAYDFAGLIRESLGIADWSATEPKALPPMTDGIPTFRRIGARGRGISLIAPRVGHPSHEALLESFKAVGSPAFPRNPSQIDDDDAIWIVVAPP